MSLSVVIRTLAGLALAAVSGILFGLAFPPFDIWPLIFIGFVPAIVAQHRIMPRKLSGLAYGVGFGMFYWAYFGPMFAGFPAGNESNWLVDYLPLMVGALAAGLSAGDVAFHERTGYRWFVLNGAVVWVAVEAIRGFAPVIGTGGSVAYALYAQPWLIQPVSIFSLYGLGLLVMLTNYAIALSLILLIDRLGRPRPGSVLIDQRLASGSATWVLVALAGWTTLSVLMLRDMGDQEGRTVRVAALQPGPSPDQSAHTRALIEQTREATALGAQLVVWPEGALNFDPTRVQADTFRTLAAQTGSYIVLGYGFRTPEGLRNEAVVLTPQGDFLEPYGKDHPVVWMGETSLTGGTYPVNDTALGTVATIICYDLNFTDTARKMAANGAQVLAVPSHDWPGLAPKQYTTLVLRAVENRVTLIKADGMYDSAIIDSAGRIVSSGASMTATRNTLVADVPLGRANALAIGWGDWVGWLCIAATAAFAIASPITAARSRKARERKLTSEGIGGNTGSSAVRKATPT